MYAVSVRTNYEKFAREVDRFAYKQLPFAVAQALTAVARDVQFHERVNEQVVLDRPRPFTEDAIRVIPARKDNHTAKVVMQELTAWYLGPYQFGGKNELNSEALLKPVNSKSDLDQYGNLPRFYMEKMKNRKDVFVGPVKTKHGTIHGVWQRSVETKTVRYLYINKRTNEKKMRRTRKGLNTSGSLKLLIRFTDAHPVQEYLDWFTVAERTINRRFERQMNEALRKARLTAR